MAFFRSYAIGALIASAAFLFAYQHGGQPGVFDHYLLTLSWSPEFCYSNPQKAECAAGQRRAFIVHGLWPEFRGGGGPEYCSPAPGPAQPAGMLDMMPDLHLIEHEWLAHGTCSGLSADNYFGQIRKAFESVRIPRQFAAPRAQFAISPVDLKKAFEGANPSLNDSGIMIQCRGPYLSAVEICLSKDLRPIPCPAVHECRARMVRVAPVR
ncbi:MAG: ribonuclease T2 [Acidobacteriaceae bacterium]|nr:ribonuclease T2 [Acidobacteriaceae bacterium]